MTGIKKSIRKAVVFVIYWAVTGSFAFVMNAVVSDTERERLFLAKNDRKDTAAELLLEETAAFQVEGTGEIMQKRVALSFDDGPHPVYTELLLDGLAERNVKAAFFVVGKNIIHNERLLDRMYKEGHVIGNHTYDHVKLSEISDDEACIQVEKTNELIYEITGAQTEYVRPPFGEWSHHMECSFSMIPVLWDVDPLDWTTKNQEQIVRHVVDEVEDGDIILLHDYYESSVKAALRIVDELQQHGYEFVTIDRIILE